MSSTRSAWQRVHRCLGVSVGLLLVLLGLSGSIITYQQELDALLHPGLLTTSSVGARVPLQRAEAAARAVMPDGATLQWARLPHEPHGVISWFYQDRAGNPWELTTAPSTAQVLGQRRSDTHALAWVYAFHATLLAGIKGNVVLGIAAFATLWLVGIGLWMWWPRRGRWRQALTIKRGVGSARLNFDLHRVIGAYSAPLLIVSAFTGIYMALPPVMTAAMSWVAPVTEPVPVKATGGPVHVTLDEAVALAQRVFPGTHPKVLVLPEAGQGAYEINLYRTEDRQWRKTGEWTAFIDASTGQALRLDGPVGGTAGDRFIAWMFPLHNGEAFGEVTRAAVCLLGLLPLALAVTGALIWWRRRKHRTHRGAVSRPIRHQAMG